MMILLMVVGVVGFVFGLVAMRAYRIGEVDSLRDRAMELEDELQESEEDREAFFGDMDIVQLDDGRYALVPEQDKIQFQFHNCHNGMCVLNNHPQGPSETHLDLPFNDGPVS